MVIILLCCLVIQHILCILLCLSIVDLLLISFIQVKFQLVIFYVCGQSYNNYNRYFIDCFRKDATVLLRRSPP